MPKAVLLAALAAAAFRMDAPAAEKRAPLPETTVSLADIAPDRPAFGLVVFHTMRGACVSQVFAGGPADRAGISPGNLLVSGDGQPLSAKSQDELMAFLAARKSMLFVVQKADGTETKIALEKEPPRRYANRDGSVTARAMDLQLSGIQPGEAPPDFEAQSADGRKIRLRSLRGKPVAVVFWATWCLPCFVELQTLKPVYAKFHPRGLEIVGVSLDDDRAKFDAFIQHNAVPWPQQFDGNGWGSQVAQQWTVVRLSATVLIDREGRVARVIRENIPADELRAAVEQLCQ